jgi:hypothetical protein
MRHMHSEAQLQQSRSGLRRRPFLLGLFAGALTLQAVFLPVIALFVLFSASDSVVIYNGVESPMGEVRLKALATLVVWFAFAVYFGPGLWRGSAMARRAFLVACVVAAVVGLVGTFVAHQGKPGLVGATTYVGISNLVGCGIFYWYLYLKPNVREFFERTSTGIASAA